MTYGGPPWKKPDTTDFEALEEKAFTYKIIIAVLDEKTGASLSHKLESLYMTKSVTKKLFLKQHLFAVRM